MVSWSEAEISAIVHNDYTSELPPKFEFFVDWIEITSLGCLPQGMTESEFFEGYSVPRNKELMRVFRDLDLVEHLGSGVPRILRSYGKMAYIYGELFTNDISCIRPSCRPSHRANQKKLGYWKKK